MSGHSRRGGRWQLAFVAFFVFLASICHAGQKGLVPPNWAKEAWTYNDSAFREIRLELDRLKFGLKRDPGRVEALYRRYVDPHLTTLRRRAQTPGAIDPFVYYCATALYAYYPKQGRERDYDIGFLLDSIPGPNSYEFARVAFCVYQLETGYRPPLVALSERLLKRDPKDALVRTYFPGMARMVSNRSRTMADKVVQVAEDLYREFPHRPEIYVPLRAEAYRDHFLATFLKASYDRMFTYIDLVLNHPGVDLETKRTWRSDREYYAKIKNRIKWRG